MRKFDNEVMLVAMTEREKLFKDWEVVTKASFEMFLGLGHLLGSSWDMSDQVKSKFSDERIKTMLRDIGRNLKYASIELKGYSAFSEKMFPGSCDSWKEALKVVEKYLPPENPIQDEEQGK